jgi:hypothetical protein
VAVVAVFGDAHAHAEEHAVIGAAEACGVQELWSLGDMTGGGPDPEHVVARTREWDGLDLEAADGAYWLLLDLQGQMATWRRAPYDPAPARLKARALGLDGAKGSVSDPQRRATGSARRCRPA